MLKVTFKNVGQGDCIFLEWKDSGEEGVAVIDCNVRGESNAAVSHLQQADHDCIDYLILFHPHADHFSGLEGILKFCSRNSIVVKYFLHTCGYDPIYLRAPFTLREEEEAFASLLKTVNRLKGSVVNKFSTINDLHSFSLTPQINLSFLSPSEFEDEKFRKTQYNEDLSLKNNPNANWLSTVIKVSIDDEYVLLTSDAEADALKRVHHDRLKSSNETLVLAQVPHHGSRHNHRKRFWKDRNCRRNIRTPAAISVGKNSYGHPSKLVISDLESLGYEVGTTGDLSQISKAKSSSSESHLLDLVSSATQPSSLTGTASDLVYRI